MNFLRSETFQRMASQLSPFTKVTLENIGKCPRHKSVTIKFEYYFLNCLNCQQKSNKTFQFSCNRLWQCQNSPSLSETNGIQRNAYRRYVHCVLSKSEANKRWKWFNKLKIGTATTIWQAILLQPNSTVQTIKDCHGGNHQQFYSKWL